MDQDKSTNPPARLGAVRINDGAPVDLTLEKVVRLLQGRGVRVAGYFQREIEIENNCCSELYLENVVDGRQFPISQALGSGSKGCRLNPQGLADATGDMLAELEERPDILVLNRFGKGEADGRGLRALMEYALLNGVPVLVALRDTYLDAFLEFSGDFHNDIAADETAILDWCNQHCENKLMDTAA